MIKRFKILFFLPALFLLSSCGQQANTFSHRASYEPQECRQGVLAKDFAPGQLEAHFQKHNSEFGYTNQEEYLQGAKNLLNSAADQDVLEKIRTNGDVLHYRVSTNEFAVMRQDGRIRTYFKADYDYWGRQ